MNLKLIQIGDCDLDWYAPRQATVKEGSRSIGLTVPVKSVNCFEWGSLRNASRNCSRFGITRAILQGSWSKALTRQIKLGTSCKPVTISVYMNLDVN